MYKSVNVLTDVEAQRFNEILFYDKIRRFLTESPVSIQTRFDSIECLFRLAGCNEYILSGIIRNRIMTNDIAYKPTKQERVVLRYRAGIPVRQSCKDMHMAYSTYYNMVKEYERTYMVHINHTATEYEYILKFLNFLDLITTTTLLGDEMYEY